MLKVKSAVQKVMLGAALAYGVAAAVTGVHAVTVTAGSSQSLSGTTAAARPELAGTVIEDRIRAFSIVAPSGATIRGTFQDRVVRYTSSGLLEFTFRIKNDAASKGNIVVVNRQNYGAYPSVDVDFRTDGLGTVGAPSAAHGGGPAARIKFDFHNNPIKPGEESLFHFIGTTATGYNETGTVGLQSNTGGYTSFKVFTPRTSTTQPTPTPTPTTEPTPTQGRPNLRTSLVLSGSPTAFPGQNISNRIKVYAKNIGTAPAAGTTGVISPPNGYMIDLMLSKDTSSPAGWATYSPSYSDDVLLLGGRISNTQDLAPLATQSYSVGATIPANTPPGNYYLWLRIDPGSKVAESNEADNTFFLPIRILRRVVVPID